jgi:DNA-binding transcriptional LysR family regulator
VRGGSIELASALDGGYWRVIETKQLRWLVAIAETGSFTGAAERLGVSQPTVSQNVRAIEESLGVVLFARDARGIRPTPAGELLLQGARHVLERLEEIARRLSEHRDGRSGLLRVGTPEPPCNYVLPPALAEFHRRHPRLLVRITTGHTAATMQRLRAGELDVALLPLPVDAERLRLVHAGRDELVAIAPPDHPWRGRLHVAARDFSTESIILYDRASQITELTLAFLLDTGVFPQVAMEVDHLEAVKELVRRGVGVAVLPAWAARREIEAGALEPHSLGDPGLFRPWGFLYADTPAQPAALRALISLFSEMLPRLFDGAASS